LGDFTVPIKLHRDVVAQLRVRVSALEAPKE
jgi:ribosomal protein L9